MVHVVTFLVSKTLLFHTLVRVPKEKNFHNPQKVPNLRSNAGGQTTRDSPVESPRQNVVAVSTNDGSCVIGILHPQCQR